MGQAESEPELLDPFPTGSPWNRMSDLELESGWLTSAASQVFLMQLGFLAFEVGFVERIWINSIIIKNIEDTVVGTLTYVLFTHTMAASPTVWGGVIGSFDHIFLIGESKAEYEAIFISAMYAVTCATIISGAVLERMKNSAYVAFTFLVLLINYSLAACWAWNPNSWLGKMGFVDCAGSFVVHGVGGITSLVACYFLGARRGAYIEANKDEDDENGKKPQKKLKDVEPATNPTMLAFGGFILWYGWFAFNITSPIISGIDAGQNLGQTGLNTLLAPCAAAVSCIIYKGCGIKRDRANSFKKIVTMEDLMGTILAGAVAMTASCFTAPWWSSLVIGFFASFVYFFAGWLVREKMVIDDPLGVCSVHLFPGFYGIFMEGVFADGSVGDAGLLFGGYKHFGVQVLGCVVGFISQFVITVFVWKILLEKVFMIWILRSKDERPIRVDTLDTYLGVGFFDIDPESAFKDMLKCANRVAKRFLLSFRVLCNNSGQGNELDFLLCIHTLRVRYRQNNKIVTNDIETIMKKIYNLYIEDNGHRRINITPQEKSLIEQSLQNKNITVFDNVYKMKFDELKAQLSAFLKNLKDPNEYKDLLKSRGMAPYILQEDWSILWITDGDEDNRDRAETIDPKQPLIAKPSKSVQDNKAVGIDISALEDQLSDNEQKEEEKKVEEEGDGVIAKPAPKEVPSASEKDTPGGIQMTTTPGTGTTTGGGSINVHQSLNEDKPAPKSNQDGVISVNMAMFDDD